MGFVRARSIALVVLCSIAGTTGSSSAADDGALTARMQAIIAARPSSPTPLAPRHATPCDGGRAAGSPCSNDDLLAFVPVGTFAATNTNSLWGWTDATTGIEYALVGADNGIAFFDLATPDHPRYLGKLPTHTGSSIWRDVRVYSDHAYVVADNNGNHGMQVFDLKQLRTVTTPQTFADTTFYGAFGRGHTISINEDTGYAYIAGTNTCPAPTATGALHMLDIHAPASPVFAGCIAVGGYTHEAQCWTYHGPDSAHTGKELCFNSNGNSGRLAIVDVSNKAAPVTLSSTPYAGSAFTHQGWLTDDHRYLLLNDELDESQQGHNARTFVFDVADIDAPVLVGYHQHALPVIDHNLYVHGQYVFESNYESGLRILRMDNLSQAQLTEVAYFDMYPASNATSFNGNWNNYRFPGSGVVIATGIDEGLFVLQPHLCDAIAAPTSLSALAAGDRRIDLLWNGTGATGARYRVERAQGGCSGKFETIADDLTSASFSDTSPSGGVDYGYRITELNSTATCASPTSTCVVARTTGTCTAPPLFGGISAATDAALAQCRLDLGWTAATPACAGPARYSVYRAPTAGFTPSASNRIATDIDATTFVDASAPSSQTQYYVVRAKDAANGAEETNHVELGAAAHGPPVDGTFVSGAETGDPIFDTSVIGGGEATNSSNEIRHAGWHIATTRAHTGSNSFWSTKANNLCVSLVSPPLPLTSGQTPQLSFWSSWDIEPNWDGGVVEISLDEGNTWSRLTPDGGYPGTITQGGALCGIAVGSGAFTGQDHTAFTRYQLSLAAFTGHTVRLRWLYRTDTAQAEDGWFVDDIELTHARVPGPCSPNVDRVFVDGFDGN
jgi:choice-of-anchor B domain-containing protein